MEILSSVAKELNLKLSQVENTVNLFDEGATVPFIARYRKEVTGNLDEEQIREVIEKVTYYRNLEKRKEEVLRLIEELEDEEDSKEIDRIMNDPNTKFSTGIEDLAKECGIDYETL